MKWDYHGNRRHLKSTSKRIIWIENVFLPTCCHLTFHRRWNKDEDRTKISCEIHYIIYKFYALRSYMTWFITETIRKSKFTWNSADLFQPNEYQNISEYNLFLTLSLPQTFSFTMSHSLWRNSKWLINTILCIVQKYNF